MSLRANGSSSAGMSVGCSSRMVVATVDLSRHFRYTVSIVFRLRRNVNVNHNFVPAVSARHMKLVVVVAPLEPFCGLLAPSEAGLGLSTRRERRRPDDAHRDDSDDRGPVGVRMQFNDRCRHAASLRANVTRRPGVPACRADARDDPRAAGGAHRAVPIRAKRHSRGAQRATRPHLGRAVERVAMMELPETNHRPSITKCQGLFSACGPGRLTAGLASNAPRLANTRGSGRPVRWFSKTPAAFVATLAADVCNTRARSRTIRPCYPPPSAIPQLGARGFITSISAQITYGTFRCIGGGASAFFCSLSVASLSLRPSLARTS